MIVLKDAYIGLISTGNIVSSQPVVNGCDIQISEVLSGNGDYQSLSNALVSITNLDVDPLSNPVFYVAVDMASYIESTSYLSINNYLPSKWMPLDVITISANENGIIGNDSAVSFILKNIPTHPQGYRHKFRFRFLNKNNIPALFELPVNMVAGTMSSGLFTANQSQWHPDETVGFSFTLFDNNKNNIGQTEFVSFANTNTAISFCGNYQFAVNKKETDVAFISCNPVGHFYFTGLNGKGEEFNGIDDFGELAGVEKLEAEVYYNTWIEDSNKVFNLNSNAIKLRFTNMYNHPTTSNTTMGNGVIQSVSQDKWRTGDYYVVLARMSDDPTEPVNKYPATQDANGKWFKVKEVPVIKQSINDVPYVSTLITDLVRGKNYDFFVGMMTRYTNTATTNTSLPSDSSLNYKHSISWDITLNITCQVS